MNLLYVQPLLATYRRVVLDALMSRFKVVLVTSVKESGRSGFRPGYSADVDVEDAPVRRLFGGKLLFQEGVIVRLIRLRPDVALVCANPRDISFWACLIISRLLGIRCFAHGQGGFAYVAPSVFRRTMYRVMTNLAHRYICYTELSRQSLVAAGCSPAKLAVADNSVCLAASVGPNERTYSENGVLFIGRLRGGCRLEWLVEAMTAARSLGHPLCLDVIGDGEMYDRYRAEFEKHHWIKWHGMVYDEQQISTISRNCRFGCYPGDAGLSVVHMMGLALPPLTHDALSEHMGPEPSYVADGDNGFLYARSGGKASLEEAIIRIAAMDAQALRAVGRRAFETYEALNSPSLGARFIRIIEDN